MQVDQSLNMMIANSKKIMLKCDLVILALGFRNQYHREFGEWINKTDEMDEGYGSGEKNTAISIFPVVI